MRCVPAIFCSVLQPNATPEDTLKAYERAMNAIEQIPHVPFDTLASRYSEDPSAKSIMAI